MRTSKEETNAKKMLASLKEQGAKLDLNYDPEQGDVFLAFNCLGEKISSLFTWKEAEIWLEGFQRGFSQR